MPLNKSQTAIEARRMELVGALRLRGRTVREIALALSTQMINPHTNEPYTTTTVHNDIKKLEKQWREAAAASIDEHKANQLAEIQEVKRQAWTDKDNGLVLKAVDLEANIVGTKAAIRNENSVAGEIVIRVVYVNKRGDGSPPDSP